MLRVRPSKNNSKVCVKAIDGRGKLQELKSKVIMNGFPELAGSNIDIDFGDVKIPSSYASINYVRDILGRLIRAKIVIDKMCWDFGSRALEALIAHELSHLLVGDDEKTASNEAIRRGFRDGFLELFAEVCRLPCTTLHETEYETILQYEHLNIGGLDCQEFCPYRQPIIHIDAME